MRNEIIDEINSFNMAIIEAKKRYINNEKFNNSLEFSNEIDLQRYIDSCNYEKVEVIKKYLNSSEIHIEELNDDDKEIITKISSLMKLLPTQMHKCIGCPCLENDYPQCEKCSFQDSCLSGNSPYPDECNESDCLNTFRYLDEIDIMY